MRLVISTVLFAIILFDLGINFSYAQDRDFTLAKLKQDVKAAYPRDRNADKDETSVDDGLVEITYMVDQQGKTFAPLVTRASMPKFVEPALRALKKHQYEPARLNGEPVQTALKKTFVFKLSAADLRSARGSTSSYTGLREQGVPDGYQSFYDRFSAELVKPVPDQVSMAKMLDRMVEFKHQSFFSLAYHALGHYRLAELSGDSAQKIRALQDLIWYDSRVKKKYRILKGDLEDAIWSALLKLDIDLGHYAEALKTYAKIKSNRPALAQPFSDYIEQIQVMRKGDQATQRVVELGASVPALVPLLKRAFTFTEVQGQLQKLKLRCQSKFNELSFQADMQYTIPQSWGECELEIIGTPGSTAKLYEL